MNLDCNTPRRTSAWIRFSAWAPLATALLAAPALAQFKVIGADGKVTYTDRQPANSTAKVTSLGSHSVLPETPAATSLPLELRQPVQRYPVVLYTVTGACEPCESARQFLRQRGVPFNEKQVRSPEDSEALERLSGGRDAPTLSIGSQMLRGLAPNVWGSYLDAAGYPRDSILPTSYQYPAATAIVERREANAASSLARAASQPGDNETPAAVPPASPSGIKF